MGTGLRPYFFGAMPSEIYLSPVSTGSTKDPIMSTNSSATPEKVSAANIKMRPAVAVPKSESAALFARLSALLRKIAPVSNKNDQVTALILACISEGIVARREIIGIGIHFGFKLFHVAQMLKYGTGIDADSGHWRRNPDGTFGLFA